MSLSKKIIEKVADIAIEVPKKIAEEGPVYVAAAGAAAVAGIGVHIADKFEEAKKVKKAHKDGYVLGINKGNKLASKKIKNKYLSRIAIAFYFSQADGKITANEKKTLNRVIEDFTDNYKISKSVNEEINNLTNGNVNFSIVKKYLDEVDIDQVDTYKKIISEIINKENKITYKEQLALDEFNSYFKQRYDREKKTLETILEGDDFSILTNDEIEKSINDYSLKYSLLESKFKKITKLSKKEISLMMVATGLQLLRIYLVNEMSSIEKANHGKKENALKDAQKKILAKFGDDKKERISKYYAPLDMIINSRGVPYDATTYEKGKKLNLFKGVEKGVNHRFATLGHDPLAGLLVGTVNIMTNTITSTRNKIPSTYHVVYSYNENKYKDPYIAAKPASLLVAIDKSLERTQKDLKPFVAALIKQLIHIATDTYTPAGIQLPGASLVFNENQVEELTKSFSFGDVHKFATSLSLQMFINLIIELIHKLMIIEDGGDIEDNLNMVRTNKIIDYSNSIATTSNVIKSNITGRIDQFDFAGFSSLIVRLFNNINFLYEVEYEFINNGLKELL